VAVYGTPVERFGEVRLQALFELDRSGASLRYENLPEALPT